MVTGAYVGRFSPVHAGHEQVIDRMVAECGLDQSLIIIGSSNQQPTMRHFFSYVERRELLLSLYPGIRVAGLPDYGDDKEWLTALDDLLALSGATAPAVTFFGGCEEDIAFFLDDGRTCSILNRFDGTTPKISATEVRDALIHGRPLDGMVNPKIADRLADLFRIKWQDFQRR